VKIGLPTQITKKSLENFKSPDIGIKKARTFFKRNPKFFLNN
jgi:hypothetical protein